MELSDVVARRRMTRRFSSTPVEPELLRRLLETALRSPSAGFAQGVDLVVLESDEARDRFWRLASDDAWRTSRSAASEGLRAAPALVVPVADPGAYAARYGEADKATSGLAGVPTGAWPVPYWLVDASFSVMLLLLAAADAGLGALFFRLHAPAETVLVGLGVPPGRTTVGAVALGHPLPGRSPGSPARRPRRPFADTLHYEQW